jgi:cytidylate kinase
VKHRSIAICGPVAAGSTTTARLLSQKLKIPHKSAGDFFRQYMLKHNIPLPQKEKVPDDIERKIDKELTDLIASQKPIIIEGLYIGYFSHNMSHVLKVLLTCDQKVRIQRALSRTHTHKETAQDVIDRDLAHDLKFRKLYTDENFLDPKFFDLIIDTTNTSIEEVMIRIIQKFKEES